LPGLVSAHEQGGKVPHYAYIANRRRLLIAAINKGMPATASNIARAVGLNPNTVMELLNGKHAASAYSIGAITAYFGGSPDDYFDRVLVTERRDNAKSEIAGDIAT
jgi:hypothetical protein